MAAKKSPGKPPRTPKPKPRALRVMVLSGPNLQLLGTREPEIYGSETLDDIHARVTEHGAGLGVEVDCRQTNHEGTLCDWIAEARTTCDAILLNAAAYTHTSIALMDALRAADLPCVEVHLSNPEAREDYRRESKIARVCVGKVAGFGGDSYVLALVGIVAKLAR
jgi:3-dehydroquinate dehydratase-2